MAGGTSPGASRSASLAPALREQARRRRAHMFHEKYGILCYLGSYVAALTYPSVSPSIEWGRDNIIFFTMRDRHDCGSHNEETRRVRRTVHKAQHNREIPSRAARRTARAISETTQLRVRDLQIGRRDGGHALVTLHGKGGKVRQCPLRPEIERVLVELVEGRSAGDAVFLNRRRQPFTRFGVYWVVERCAAQVPALVGRKITPHVLRHTTACHLVFAGVDINTVRAWLGHSSIDTTNIYAEINLKMKAEAMALCDVAEPDPGRPWKEDKDLMAFLNSY